MKKVLLVDDHHVIRDGIKLYFNGHAEFEIADEAENGEVALQLMNQNQYDILISDVQMPKLSGLDLMENVKESYPSQKVLVLSGRDDPGAINKMISLGANGYILKSAPKEELFQAIKTILSGENYYSKEVYEIIVAHMAKIQPKQRLTLEKDISDREIEVLRLITKEHTNQEIADKLFISIRTVEGHKRNLLEKTGCKNVAGLVMYAVERDLL